MAMNFTQGAYRIISWSRSAVDSLTCLLLCFAADVSIAHPFPKQLLPDKLSLDPGKGINGNVPIAVAICANASMACHLVLEMYPDDLLSALSSLGHMLQGKMERNGQHNIEVSQVKVGIRSQYVFLQFGKLECRVCEDTGLVYAASTTFNG
jgi:hypothetical protein